MKTCLNCHTDNPDDAQYCSTCRFTLDWSTTKSDDPTTVMEAVTLPALELALGPGEVGVVAGSPAAFDVRLANRGQAPAHVKLYVSGPAQAYARAEPWELEVGAGATAGAVLTVTMPPDTPPQTMPVELYATEAGSAGASVNAQAHLVVAPPPPSAAPRSAERGAAPSAPSAPRRGWVVPVVVLALIAVLVVVAFAVLSDSGGGGGGGDGGGGGTTGVARQPTCVHSEPRYGRDTYVRGGSGCLALNEGESFAVQCSENGLMRLTEPGEVAGNWITNDPRFVTLETDPPSC